jgi:DNA-binding beta-propeller fold protein YncE
VGLSGGGLAVLNLSTLELEKHIPLSSDLEALAPGPEAGTVYGALSSGQVVLVDVVRGEVVARAGDLGRPRGLVFDSATGSLLVADAQEGIIVRFSRDLSARLAAGALDDLPDQMLLDSAGRRLYVMLPGARQVLALDADTLQPVAEAELVGGPLIEMALDAARGRLYVLSALSPHYRGLSVLKAEGLSSLALVAGGPATPLKQATVLAISPDGYLLVAEGTDLYRISPEDFSVANLARLEYPVGRGGLVAEPTTGRIVWINSAGIFAEGSLNQPIPPTPISNNP